MLHIRAPRCLRGADGNTTTRVNGVRLSKGFGSAVQALSPSDEVARGIDDLFINSRYQANALMDALLPCSGLIGDLWPCA